MKPGPQRYFSGFFAFALACMTVSCGGGGGGGVAPSPGGGGTLSPQTAALQITIDGTSSTSRARRPAYLSAATASVTIAVNGGAATAQNLSLGSSGCTLSSNGAPMCVVTLAAPIGSDALTITTYDGANGTGHVLSKGTVTSVVVAGQTNSVGLTLQALPQSVLISIAPGQTGVTGNQTTGFTLQGTGAKTFVIAALDAAGDVIVGPGAPAIAVVPSLPSALTITAVSGSADEFTLTPVTPGTKLSLTVTATTSGTSGAPATATTALSLAAVPPSSLPKTTYVYENEVVLGASIGEIDVFAAGSVNTVTPKKMSSALLYPTGGTLTFGPGGALYATGNTDQGDLVVEYTAAQLSAGTGPTSIVESYDYNLLHNQPGNQNALLLTSSLAVDSHGNLFVVGEPNAYPPNFSVYEFPAGFTPTTVPTKIPASPTGETGAQSVYVDSKDNLYVVNSTMAAGTSILIFGSSSPSSAPVRTIGGSNAGFTTVTSLGVGPDGTLTVYDGVTFEVYVFAPGAANNPSPVSVFQSPALNWTTPITVDANNNVYGSQFFYGASTYYDLAVFPANATSVVQPLFTVQSAALAPTGILTGP
jgi:hypothetical protein